MSQSNSQVNPDDLLRAFLQEKDDHAAQRYLQRLVESVTPVIVGAVRRKVSVEGTVFVGTKKGQRQEEQDRDDLQGEAVAKFVAVLQEARKAYIRDVHAYAAVVAYNVVSEYRRIRAPLRHSLTNQIRYLLNHQPDLCAWEGEKGIRIGGFDKWRIEGKPAHIVSAKLRQLQDQPSLFSLKIAPTFSCAQVSAQGLAAMLNWVKHPIPVSDLVGIWAELMGIRDERPQDLMALDEGREHATAVVGIPPALGQRMLLEGWWTEIRKMSPNECAALLLQARDTQGNSPLELLQVEGVASVHEMAAVMKMAPEDLTRLWNDLPLDDVRIARQLRMHPQSVARLRMNTRERMKQYLAFFPEMATTTR